MKNADVIFKYLLLESVLGPIVQWLRRVLDVDEIQVQFLVGPFVITHTYREALKMKTLDLQQTVFLAFLIAIILNAIDLFFSIWFLGPIALGKEAIKEFCLIWFLVNLAATIVIFYPHIINVKRFEEGELVSFKKYLIWSWLIWFIYSVFTPFYWLFKNIN